MKLRLILFFFVISSASYGQSIQFLDKIKYEDKSRIGRDFYSVYASIGPSAYYGELADISSIFNPKLLGFNWKDSNYGRASLGFNYRIRAYTPLSLRAELSFYTIEGADSTSESTWRSNKRQLSFRSHNFEGWVGAQLDLIRFSGRSGFYGSQYPVTAYIYTGVGITSVNPQTRHLGEWVDLRPLQTEGVSYQNWAIIWPTGLGVRVKFLASLTFGVDMGYRVAFTDYLDDVSGSYIDSASYISPLAKTVADPAGIHTAGDGRGNPTTYDGYLFTSFIIQYNFQNGIFTPRRAPNGFSATTDGLDGNWFERLFKPKRRRRNNTRRRRN